MPIPTEPGHYYYRLPSSLLVLKLPGPGCTDAYAMTERVVLSFAQGGEWGLRIPPPERLEALEELAARAPYRIDKERMRMACVWCGEDVNEPHHHTCPWQRAQPRTEEK